MDGGDDGNKGEGEEGTRAEERDGGVTGLVSGVSRLEAHDGDGRDSLDVEDAGLDGEGGDCEDEG